MSRTTIRLFNTKKHFQDIDIEYSPSMSLDTVELARLFLPTTIQAIDYQVSRFS